MYCSPAACPCVADTGTPAGAVSSPICFWRRSEEGATLVVTGCGGFRARSDPATATAVVRLKEGTVSAKDWACLFPNFSWPLVIL